MPSAGGNYRLQLSPTRSEAEAKAYKIKFQDKSYIQLINEMSVEEGTYKLDPDKSPKTIDNLHGSGAHKGKKQYGIYKLEGDTWTVCMTQPGAAKTDRPKDFTTKNTSNVVFVFERVK